MFVKGGGRGVLHVRGGIVEPLPELLDLFVRIAPLDRAVVLRLSQFVRLQKLLLNAPHAFAHLANLKVDAHLHEFVHPLGCVRCVSSFKMPHVACQLVTDRRDFIAVGASEHLKITLWLRAVYDVRVGGGERGG